MAHSLAKPSMPRVGSESRVPDHQEMKWAQFGGRLNQAQIRIPFDRVNHAAGDREDQFGTWETTKGRTKIGQADRGSPFGAQRSKLFVWDVLYARKCRDYKVLRG